MITMVLQGGLGNQMFQYAMGLAQARRLGVELQLDVTRLQHDRMRQYNLGLFKIDDKLVIGSRATVLESSMRYDQNLVDRIADNDVIERNYQCEKYFLSVQDEVRQKFVPRQSLPQLFVPSMIKSIKDAGNRSVFLGIRRTDYVEKQDFHGVLGRSYYEQAIDRIRLDRGIEPMIFIFSDDPSWCKKNMLTIGKEVMFPGSYDQTTPGHLGREDVDLYLMSLCQHGIIANSTFHWWGAWLGDTKTDRTIIGPKQWFTTTTEDATDIIPDRWIRL